MKTRHHESDADCDDDWDLLLPTLNAAQLQQLTECIKAGDGSGWASVTDRSEYALNMVWWKRGLLAAHGMYEDALLTAYTHTKHNNLAIAPALIQRAFDYADRTRLGDAGHPLPIAGPLTVYRGVCGRGSKRRVRGLSWTLDCDLAAWFADRGCGIDMAVYTATVQPGDIYCFYDGRSEQEVICRPARPDRLAMTAAQIREAAQRVVDRKVPLVETVAAAVPVAAVHQLTASSFDLLNLNSFFTGGRHE